MENEAGSLVAERTLKILLLFENNDYLTLSQITKEMNISKTSTYRLVKTLTDLGFLSKNENKKYRLGPSILNLAKNINSDLTTIIKPYLNLLLEKTMESVYVSVFINPNEYMFIDGKESAHPLRYSVELYNPMPANAGSAAKAHLAFQQSDLETVVENISLESYTSNTIIDKQELINELNSIREKGYSTSIGERYDEVVGISAPIFEKDNKVKVVITMFIPKSRVSDELFKKYISIMVETARKISNILGGSKR